jgi:hypothetical protein
MWQKIPIFENKISEYDHKGFIINHKDNKIVNLLNNYSILLPFTLCEQSSLYQYELFFTDKLLILTLLINLEQLKIHLLNNNKIPFKNELFIILKYSKNINKPVLKETTLMFNKFISLKNITEHYKYVRYTGDDTIRLNNIEFKLIEESILINNNKEYKPINIFFLFCNRIMQDSLKNIKKLCIIDDSSKYNGEHDLIITKKNYKKIKLKDIYNFSKIIIDMDFFVSKTYLSSYKDFHTHVNSRYAFNNYKKYINNIDFETSFFNIELLDNFKILINDVDFKKLTNHPIKFSKNILIFNFNKISSTQVVESLNYLAYYSQFRYNQMCNLNNWSYHPFYLPDKLLNYYQNIVKVNVRSHNSKVALIFKPIISSNNGFCDVYKTDIMDKSFYQFNCGHKFMIDNFNLFISKYESCFACQIPINAISYYVNQSTCIADLIGEEFNKIYTADRPYYIIQNFITNKLQFLLNNFNNIHYIDSIDIKLNEKNVSCFKKGYLCFGGKYSDYEIVNIISNLKYEVGTFDIIKLSQSI